MDQSQLFTLDAVQQVLVVVNSAEHIEESIMRSVQRMWQPFDALLWLAVFVYLAMTSLVLLIQEVDIPGNVWRMTYDV